MVRIWPGHRTAVLIANEIRRTAEGTLIIRRWSSLAPNLIDWTNSGNKLKHGSVEVRENIISEKEERNLLQELNLVLKRKRVQRNHWDSVIKNYKEIERPDSSWGLENAKTIERIRYELESNLKWGQLKWLPVHVIDLAEDGEINNHVDSIKFSGGVVSGVSLVSPSIMRVSRVYKNVKCTVDMFLPPRSLYILKDEARYDWEHEILRGVYWNGKMIEEARRVSLIFRDEFSHTTLVG